ncbi:hypothetical protein RHOFW510R12_00200 [Rhodanobacter sp. FW510-R12]
MRLSALTPLPSVAAIRRTVDGYKNFQALLAGYRCGLFDWLEQHGPAERPVIAEALQLRGAHLGAFLQTLQDLGLVEREGNAYALANHMHGVLCNSSEWCQAETLEQLLAPHCGWSDLGLFMDNEWIQNTPPEVAATHDPFLGEALRLAAHLAERQAQHPDQWLNLLCFDGSHGLFGAAIAQRFPQARLIVVVPPETVERVRQLLELHGVSARCEVVGGTPLEPQFPAQFDHVIVFHSLYAVRKSIDDALLALAGCLDPGGELCLAHWFCLEACETAPGGLRDLDKAVLTDSHSLCGIERFGGRLEQAGLAHPERHDLAGEYGQTKVHFARKPSAC